MDYFPSDQERFATAVEPLIDYLRDTYPMSELSHLDPATNSVPEADLGDILAYDWEGDGAWEHLALVTGFAEGQYLLVSEWGVDSADYVRRGWTYSEISGHWLQKSYPDMEVALLHIDMTLPNRY